MGRPLAPQEYQQLIKQIGHPGLLAGRYGPRRQLIGPEILPFYWLERSTRDPLTQERIDDNVPTAVAADDIVAGERRECGLDAGRTAQPVTSAHVGREQLAAILEHDSA